MPNERGEYNGPEITIERDAYGLSIRVAGKRESIVLDHSDDSGTRVFLFDENENAIAEHQLTDDR